MKTNRTAAAVIAVIFMVRISYAADTSPTTEDVDNAFKVLLLDDDRVVDGPIVRQADGSYRLKRQGGVVTFPANQVLIAAQHVSELYEGKRKRLPPHDIGEHAKLYRWCLAHKLPEQAEKELRHILSIDPSHPMANQQLKLIEHRRQSPKAQGAARTVAHRPLPARPFEVIDGFSRGHGKEVFERYVLIERALLNRCAGTGCHASARHVGDLKLFKRSEGDTNDARLTARNLQSVQKCINLDRPGESALLVKAIEPHGPLSIAPLGGVNDPFYKELRDWVYRVSETWLWDDSVVERPGKRRPSPIRSEGNDSDKEEFGMDRTVAADKERYRRPVRPSTPGDAPAAPSFAPVADDAPPAEPRPAPRTTKRPSPTKIKDPFDPSSFNDEFNLKPPAESEPKTPTSKTAPRSSSNETKGDAQSNRREGAPNANVRKTGEEIGNVSREHDVSGSTAAESHDSPALPKELELPMDRKGKSSFRAAPLPFNLRKSAPLR